MLDHRPLGLLDRAGLRKAALDAGFDVLHDEPHAVAGTSSHAPLRCVVGRAAGAGGWLGGLSMANVVEAMGGTADRPANGASDGMAGWFPAADKAALERLLARAWALSRALPDALERRFEAALAATSATERDATVRRRIGQDLFRQGLLALWGGRCAITGLAVPELLRASHAKPWADSSDAERLDVHNGLLLAAHWDAAFDAGLVTVTPAGSVLGSPALPADAAGLLGLRDGLRVRLAAAHEPYLHWHGERVFRRG
jgi:putative restriction endonuclease